MLEGLGAAHAQGRKSAARLPIPEGLRWHADPELLRRVLVNMTLNAQESSQAGATVTLGMEVSPGVKHFQVHDIGCITPEVQGRLFQRSFSTKATRGRGLGTYSMKVFGETYLGGQVSFRSAPETGATFELALPAPQDQVIGGFGVSIPLRQHLAWIHCPHLLH